MVLQIGLFSLGYEVWQWLILFQTLQSADSVLVDRRRLTLYIVKSCAKIFAASVGITDYKLVMASHNHQSVVQKLVGLTEFLFAANLVNFTAAPLNGMHLFQTF